mgnify:CR=1 FL=1
MSEEKATPVSTPKFTVEQLANSRKYAEKRDVLHAVLDYKKQYSHAEVEKAIESFNKRDLSKGVKK